MDEKDKARKFMLAHGYEEKITPIRHFFCPRCGKCIPSYPCLHCNYSEPETVLREYYRFEKV